MADGTDHRYANNPNRGRKLRHNGSNPTGTQTNSFTPAYSGSDESINKYQMLNERVNMSESEHNPTKASREMRGDTGLIFKEPLS